MIEASRKLGCKKNIILTECIQISLGSVAEGQERGLVAVKIPTRPFLTIPSFVTQGSCLLQILFTTFLAKSSTCTYISRCKN